MMLVLARLFMTDSGVHWLSDNPASTKVFRGFAGWLAGLRQLLLRLPRLSIACLCAADTCERMAYSAR
jgi:hypothetical protein